MPAAEPVAEAPLDDDEIQDLLASFHGHSALVLAVSGGPDSLGLMVAAARWRALAGEGPALHVASVDHGLRPEAAGECAMVVEEARRLGLPATILAWEGDKPASGLQEAARDTRLALLAAHARAVGATGIVLAHHREDQAETVFMRLLRGSGPLGLKGMASTSQRDGLALLRPFLFVPKARLAATARDAGLTPVHDPSNDDPRFTRVRIRKILRDLEGEGLDAERLAILAGRMQMLDAAGAHHAARLAEATTVPAGTQGAEAYDGTTWLEAPFTDVLRLLADAIARLGDPDVDARLEALEGLTGEVLMAIAGGEALRRNLQGALVSVSPQGRVIVACEPARRSARN